MTSAPPEPDPENTLDLEPGSAESVLVTGSRLDNQAW